MRWSLVLGVIGAIFGILIGIVLMPQVMGNWNGQMYPFFSTNPDSSTLIAAAAIAIVGGIIGLAGAALGKKIGGALMIIAGILIFVASAAGGLLAMILLIVGGILALRGEG